MEKCLYTWVMRERPYQKLIAWKEAHSLCVWVYKITMTFPQHEKFALADQMRRAAYSVPMNIVEGNSRRSSKDQARFLEIAISSLEELHYQCILANELEYLDMKILEDADDRIRRVGFLTQKLRASIL